MGAAKYNPTAQAAKRGELPPKPPKMSKREQEAFIRSLVLQKTGWGRLGVLFGSKPHY